MSARARCDALIAAAGEGSRLGLGPKALLRTADGRSLIERLACMARDVADTVWIAALPRQRAEIQAALPWAHVIDGGAHRSDSYSLLAAASSAPWKMLLDVARPFTRAALMREVLALAQAQSGAAMAVLEEPVPAVLCDGEGRVFDALPSGAWRIPQTPQVFATQQLDAALLAARAARTQSICEAALIAGITLHTVVGPADNLKLTGAWDWTLAQLLYAGTER